MMIWEGGGLCYTAPTILNFPKDHHLYTSVVSRATRFKLLFTRCNLLPGTCGETLIGPQIAYGVYLSRFERETLKEQKEGRAHSELM